MRLQQIDPEALCFWVVCPRVRARAEAFNDLFCQLLVYFHTSIMDSF